MLPRASGGHGVDTQRRGGAGRGGGNSARPGVGGALQRRQLCPVEAMSGREGRTLSLDAFPSSSFFNGVCFLMKEDAFL